MRRPEAGNGDLWKGMAAGAVAGTLGTLAMSVYQRLWKQVVPEPPRSLDTLHPAERGWADSVHEVRHSGRRGPDDATVEAADKLSRHLLDRGLSREEKVVAGPLFHYLFGAVAGAVYGALAERAPRVTVGAGVPFGLVVWLTSDEIALPALGLTPPPSASPPSRHALSFSAHCVYGASTEWVRRALRPAANDRY